MTERSYADATFDELKILTTEPAVEKLKQQAREFADLINDSSNVSSEERSAFIAELNHSWPFLAKRVVVTGQVELEGTQTGQLERTYIEEAPLVSDGFCFRNDVVEFDDEIIADSWLPAFRFKQYIGGDAYRYGWAFFDQIEIVYPARSTELIETRLRHFHGDVVEELDSLVLNGDNEDERTLALADFTLAINPDEPMDRQFMTDTQDYLTSILDYDTELPYCVDVAGAFYAESEDGVCERANGEEISGYFSPQGIQFLPSEDNEEDSAVHTFIPCVEGLLHSANRAKAPYHVYFPVSSLKIFASLRRP